jgi:hypothetical protein
LQYAIIKTLNLGNNAFWHNYSSELPLLHQVEFAAVPQPWETS